MKTYEVWINKFDQKGTKQLLIDNIEEVKKIAIEAIENNWYIEIK